MSTTMTAPRKAPAAKRTTVALKVAMAITGLFFVIFVLAHMYGNFKMFQGAEAFDEYAHHLRVMGEPYLPFGGALWILRILLLAAVVIHVVSAFILWKRNRDARGGKYHTFKPVQQTYSARTMRWGGVIILLFVVFHILQFTTLTIEVGGSFDSPYDRMVAAYQPEYWWVFAIYLIALAALAFHVRHGVWSALQTMGWSSKAREATFHTIAIVVALLLFVGFMAAPTAILIGAVN